MSDQAPVIVSACLLGIRCRYDGAHSRDESVVDALRGSAVVALCPEQLGGLPTPREPAHLAGGTGGDVWRGRARVLRVRDGADLTDTFMAGARRTLAAAREAGATSAIMKNGSPSCGISRVVREGVAVSGAGVTSALLEAEGLTVEQAG